MRSIRSFTALACLVLASLFTFTSALGQDASEPCPEVIATYGRVYFLIPTHANEGGTCVPNAPVTLAPTPKADCPDTPVTGTNGETYFVPRFKRGDHCFFTDAVSTVFYPSNVPTPHEAAAADGVRIDADGRVRASAPAPAPAEGSEPRRGAPAPSPAPAAAPAPAAETGAETNSTYQLDIPGVPDAFIITMRDIVPDLGSRDEFIVACHGKQDVWQETFEAAQAADRRAVELTARAKHIVQTLHRDDRLPHVQGWLDAAVEYVAEQSSRLQASSRADHAPLAGLWTRAALKDAGPSACSDLWDFAEAAAARDIIMTGALSAIASMSWGITSALDGREAADRHWAHLNALGGGFLSPPIPPPDGL